MRAWVYNSIRGLLNGWARNCYIVVSTWGNPSFWRDAEYVFKEMPVTACCALIPVIKHVLEKHGVNSIEQVYVLGLDSIIDSPCSITTGDNACRKAFCECFEKLQNHSFSNYDSIANKAKYLYECTYRGLLLSYLVNQVDRCTLDELTRKTRVLVLPATGSPGSTWRFEGEPEDYFSIALLEIGADVLRAGESKCESVKILFDSTHGINYMPVLTLKLVEIIAQLIWLKRRVRVKIEAYNSDPYPPRKSGTVKLSINKIYEKEISEVNVPYIKEVKSHGTYEKPRTPYQDVLSDHAKRLVRNAASSAHSPTPLALLYACYDYLEDCLSTTREKPEHVTRHIPYSEDELTRVNESFLHLVYKIVETWKRNIEVKNNAVKRSIYVISNAAWILLLVGAICQYVYNKFREDPRYVKILGNVPAFSLKLLKHLNNHIYRRVHNTMGYLIDDELGKIERLVNQLSGQHVAARECWEYGKLREMYEKRAEEGSRSATPQERILIAHAGLQYDLVDVCIHENEIYLKYKNRETVKSVYESLKNVFDRRFGT